MFKAVDKWLAGYFRSVLSRPARVAGTRHLMVCVCDHYEPFRDKADQATARKTVRDWLAAYPASVDPFRDADGRPPRHTFFYPQEEYDPAILDDLAAFCRHGYGEVEIHLHHRHDTAEGLREKLVTFRDLLHQKHGLLGKETVVRSPESEVRIQNSESKIDNQKSEISLPEHRTLNTEHYSSPRYAFIHGNWSLCNSRPDGDWCGVNEELGILADTGCYADFTFPSAPSPTQPRMVNAIYYARDTPGKPRGADRGEKVFRSQNPESRIQNSESKIDNQKSEISLPEHSPSPLLLITGPLALNWRRRKWGVLPRLENADISGGNPPTPDRVRLWAEQEIHVGGRPDWVFVKLHTHGCMPANARVLLGDAMRQAHEVLQREFNDGQRWQLHYVTAREMHNLVKAAEANLPAPPNQYRDTPITWKT